jgi:hypothetical protein
MGVHKIIGDRPLFTIDITALADSSGFILAQA